MPTNTNTGDPSRTGNPDDTRMGKKRWDAFVERVHLFIERVPIYICPFVLVGAEWTLRAIAPTGSPAAVDIKAFVGPTLAAVGIGLVLPLTVRRSPTIKRLKELKENLKKCLPEPAATEIAKVSLENIEEGVRMKVLQPPAEPDFIRWCWVFVFILATIWGLALYLSIKHLDDLWWTLPYNYFAGFAGFVMGFILSEVREAIG